MKQAIACMPLRKNVPEPHKDWRLTVCPVCGAECWESGFLRQMKEKHHVKSACTMCALKGAGK